MGLKVFSVSEMVAAEKAADAAGVTYAQMMETAGSAVAEAIQARFDVAGGSILVLVGPGNNGGDGLVAGRYLAEAGADVAFYLAKPRDPAQDPNYARVRDMGLFTLEAHFDQRFRVLRTRLNITDLLIDALLGTGVSRPIGGDLAKLMQQVKAGVADRQAFLQGDGRSRLVSISKVSSDQGSRGERSSRSPAPRLPIIAVDCPSGLNCDTGALDPLALTADLTVTFAGPKRGHFIFPGAAACGELVVADIDISPELPVVEAVPVELATAEFMRPLLPPRKPDGHKGTFGKVLVAAGCDQYRGAPILAAKGAFRAGAGLVALAVPAVIREAATIQVPEATYAAITDERQLSAAAAQMLRAQSEAYQAMLIGPGLGAAASFMDALLADTLSLPPLVIDADGLNLLAHMPDWHTKLPPATILTPHPGEMARLMDISLPDLKQMDRVEAAGERARAWGHVVLLKGAYTVVAAPDGRITILPFANPVLAVGGSGDVLSGVIVALLGQGMAPYEAAVLGGYLHGATSELYPGNAGLLASEIADLIPQVIHQLQ